MKSKRSELGPGTSSLCCFNLTATYGKQGYILATCSVLLFNDNRPSQRGLAQPKS